VPVYNGFEALDRCLSALARHRPAESALILVDDASTDARVAPRLEEFAKSQPDTQISVSPKNRGYIASANHGASLASADADLVFLNADTEVASGWADEMRVALDSQPDADVCCPLSNNATILSVPQFQQDNSLPFDWGVDQAAAFFRSVAGDVRAIPIPTPVGFCMWIRREAWNRWGPFDEAFGRGYGEEDDFGQKVIAAGRFVICAPRAFVYHQGAASFGTGEQLGAERRANNALLLSRWPQYDARTRAWCRVNPLRPLHERIWASLIAPPESRPIHVLHVLRQWQTEGPLRENTIAIVEATYGFAIHTVAVPTADRGAWMDAIDFESEQGLRVIGLIDFESAFQRFLLASPAQVVHFHGPQLLDAARRERPVLTTPGDTADPARCRDAYARIARGA
jgi:GT2 family glycosyltransferase